MEAIKYSIIEKNKKVVKIPKLYGRIRTGKKVSSSWEVNFLEEEQARRAPRGTRGFGGGKADAGLAWRQDFHFQRKGGRQTKSDAVPIFL